MHIEPVPPSWRRNGCASSAAGSRHPAGRTPPRGRLDDPELDAAAADAADLASRVARGEARLFRLGLYLSGHVDTEPELADRVTEVRALASSLLLDVAPATWRQLQGWIIGLPLAFDTLGMKRVFDTDALAAAFSFISSDPPPPPPPPPPPTRAWACSTD